MCQLQSSKLHASLQNLRSHLFNVKDMQSFILPRSLPLDLHRKRGLETLAFNLGPQTPFSLFGTEVEKHTLKSDVHGDSINP